MQASPSIPNSISISVRVYTPNQKEGSVTSQKVPIPVYLQPAYFHIVFCKQDCWPKIDGMNPVLQ